MFKRQFEDDSDFSVKKYYRRKNIKKRKTRVRGNGIEPEFQQQSGKWNLQETKLYVQFLKQNKTVIDDFKYRREMKIFKQMSNYVKTRTPDQCRSHHQKVQKLHKHIQDIIRVYERKVMFGGIKRAKIYSNIVLVSAFEKQEKTTCLIESEHYFTEAVEDKTIFIIIKEDQMAQY